MQKFLPILFKSHKYIGLFISAFFLMWFVTGVVLIYHPYPSVSEKLVNEKKEVLPSSLPDLDYIAQRVEGEIKSVRIREFQGQTLMDVKTSKRKYLLTTDTLQDIKPIDYLCVEKVARQWSDAPIKRVDTLRKRSQWVLFTRYEKELPIYKFHFDDKYKTQLFVSGTTAEVQQLITAKQRFWAYVGAIPHKLYIPALRRNTQMWMDSFVVGATICLVAAITGFILGIYIFVRRKKVKGVWGNPYRKRWQRIHFSFGLIFGIFLISWAVSGLFAMKRVPQWLIKTEAPYVFDKTKLWGKNILPTDTYKLGFDKLHQEYPQLKQIKLGRFAEIPVYIIIEGENERYIDASGDDVKILEIPQQTIENGFRKIYGEQVTMKISLLEEYDNYYINLRRTYTLPVYKVEVDNNDRDLYYVSPTDGYIKYLNKNKKADRWLFNGLHYLNLPWLFSKPVLWTICIWVLCGGCTMVCLSGLVLGVKSLFKRK